MRTIRSLVEGKTCISVFQEDSVAHAAEEMAKYDVGAVPVLARETNQLVGIFSERDLLFLLQDCEGYLRTNTSRDTVQSKRMIGSHPSLPPREARVYFCEMYGDDDRDNCAQCLSSRR